MLHLGDDPISLVDLKEMVRNAQRASIRDLAARLNNPEH